jgi:alpha-tubulin suppressor-like RCC1 family protein
VVPGPHDDQLTDQLIRIGRAFLLLAAALVGCASDAPAAHPVVQVVGGRAHSCALFGDGTVSCWGMGMPPARVAGLTGLRALAAGADGTCAITAERLVRCWGQESFTVMEPGGSPLGGVEHLALGLTFGCAANAVGTYCWGKNDLGQLAQPLAVTESKQAVLAAPGPARFLGAGQAVVTHDGADRLCAWGSNGTHQITSDDVMLTYTSPQCGIVREVAQLTVGADHTCVRHPGGSFACWGERYYGQLGLGGTVDDTLDVPPFGRDTRLAAPVRDLVAGASHTCALLDGGAVTCFGLNSKGQIGPGATTTAEEVRDPAPVTGFAGPVTALGAGPSAQHTCAIVNGGTVQCWGSNSDGQLGDGASPPDPTRFSQGPVSVRF